MEQAWKAGDRQPGYRENSRESRVPRARLSNSNVAEAGLVPHPLGYRGQQCALIQRTSQKKYVYLVDPASSHMLVSKIKPCMSQYIPLQGETANGSLDQLWFLRSYNPTWITVVILELIHATKLRPSGKSAFIRSKPISVRQRAGLVMMTLDNFERIARLRRRRRIFQMSALSTCVGT